MQIANNKSLKENPQKSAIWYDSKQGRDHKEETKHIKLCLQKYPPHHTTPHLLGGVNNGTWWWHHDLKACYLGRFNTKLLLFSEMLKFSEISSFFFSK
jgi:hypothetical protein